MEAGRSARLVEAFALAHEFHRDQRRKRGGIPYITHLMGVAALVGEYGGDEAQMIAALLHDAGEDQGGETALERIRERFGAQVADYVAECSDTLETPKPPWRARKEGFVERLREASPGARLIVAADKLYNWRALTAALRVEGEAFWNAFRGGRDGTLWFAAESARALATGWSHPILHDLDLAIDALRRSGE